MFWCLILCFPSPFCVCHNHLCLIAFFLFLYFWPGYTIWTSIILKKNKTLLQDLFTVAFLIGNRFEKGDNSRTFWKDYLATMRSRSQMLATYIHTTKAFLKKKEKGYEIHFTFSRYYWTGFSIEIGLAIEEGASNLTGRCPHLLSSSKLKLK